LYFVVVSGFREVTGVIKKCWKRVLPNSPHDRNLTTKQVEDILSAGSYLPLHECPLTIGFLTEILGAWVEDYFRLPASEENIQNLIRELSRIAGGCGLQFSDRTAPNFYFAESCGSVRWVPLLNENVKSEILSMQLVVKLQGTKPPMPSRDRPDFVPSEVSRAVQAELKDPEAVGAVSREMLNKTALYELLSCLVSILLATLNSRCSKTGGALLRNSANLIAQLTDDPVFLKPFKGFGYVLGFYLKVVFLRVVSHPDISSQLEGLADAYDAYLTDVKLAKESGSNKDLKELAVQNLNETVLMIVLVLLGGVDRLQDCFTKQFLIAFLQKDFLEGSLSETWREYKRNHPNAKIHQGIPSQQKNRAIIKPSAPDTFGEDAFPSLPTPAPRVTIPATPANRKIPATPANRKIPAAADSTRDLTESES
jgi:hypothetical protein